MDVCRDIKELIRYLRDPNVRARNAVYKEGNRGRWIKRGIERDAAPDRYQQGVLEGDACLQRIERKGPPAARAVASVTRRATLNPALSTLSAVLAQHGVFVFFSMGWLDGPVGRAVSVAGREALLAMRDPGDKALVGAHFNTEIRASGTLPQERSLARAALTADVPLDQPAAAVAAEKSLGLCLNHDTLARTRVEHVLADFAHQFNQVSHLGTQNYVVLNRSVLREMARETTDPAVRERASGVLDECLAIENELDSLCKPDEWEAGYTRILGIQRSFLDPMPGIS
ncbi:MAG: hypothetical protein AB1758_20790 [Candidatus Eremiobacterota bacterium]